MTYAEELAIKTKIGKILAKEYFGKSEKIQDEDLKRIYWNIANFCDDRNAGSAGAREAIYEMGHRPAAYSPRDINQNWKVVKRMHAFLNRRQALLDKYGIKVSVGA